MRIDLNLGQCQVESSKLDKQHRSLAARGAHSHDIEKDVSGAQFALPNLMNQAIGQPEVRSDLVQALRTKVQSGEYQVNATAVASAMFEQLF